MSRDSNLSSSDWWLQRSGEPSDGDHVDTVAKTLQEIATQGVISSLGETISPRVSITGEDRRRAKTHVVHDITSSLSSAVTGSMPELNTTTVVVTPQVTKHPKIYHPMMSFEYDDQYECDTADKTSSQLEITEDQTAMCEISETEEDTNEAPV